MSTAHWQHPIAVAGLVYIDALLLIFPSLNNDVRVVATKSLQAETAGLFNVDQRTLSFYLFLKALSLVQRFIKEK